MADKKLRLPLQYVIENTLTVPFTFTVHHTDEQFTLQAGESVVFDIKTYGEYTYYEKACKKIAFREYEMGDVTYAFTNGMDMRNIILTDTTFAPYRENFTYTVKSGDILIMPLDSLAKGAYYVNLGVGDITRSLQAGSIWTGSGRGNIADGIVFDFVGQKTVDNKVIDCYKAYGEVPYLQADMYFEAGNRVYYSHARGIITSQAVTIGGTTETYDAKDYAFAGAYIVFVNPTGIVSVDVTKGSMDEEMHNYYEFDFTSTTKQAPYEGLGTVFISNLASSGSNYTFTVLNQPTEGLKVVGKVSEDRAIPIEYHQDLSGWIEMTESSGNWVLTDETPVQMTAYVNIAYVTEDNLAVAVGVDGPIMV